MLLIFGGSQAVRRFNAAVAEALPRLVERVTVIHVTGDDGYAAALAGREALPAGLRDRYRPYPFLRDEMLAALAAADLVVGRAGSSTLAEATALGLPMVVVPYPHAAGHQRANAGEPGRCRGRPAGRRTRRSTPTRCSTPRRSSTIRRPRARWPLRRVRSDVRRAADAVADLVLAARRARGRLPDADEIERLAAAASAHDAQLRRHRDRRPTSSAGSASRPSRDEPLAAVHDDAGRRPGRPVRRRPTTPSSCARSSGSRGPASSRTSSSGGGATSSSPTPGIRGLVIQVRAEGSRIDGDRYIAEAGVPDGPRRDRDPARRPDRARVRAGDPGHRRRRGLGQRRRARGRRRGRSSSPRASSPAMATESIAGRRRPRARLPRQPVQGRGRCRGADVVDRRHLPTRARPTPSSIKERLDEIRRWRQAHQPLGLPSAGSVFRNPPGDSAGRLIDAAGLEGHPHRRRGRVARSTPTSSSTTRRARAADVRRLAELVRETVLARAGVDLDFEVEFVGDWPAGARR